MGFKHPSALIADSFLKEKKKIGLILIEVDFRF